MAVRPGSEERTARWPPPLFVLTPGRSYSSVVVQMLGCHPDLYAFPELVLFGSETLDAWLDATPTDPRDRELRMSGVLRALAEVRFGGQSGEGVEAARAHLETLRGRPTAAVLDELLEAVAPRIGIEKSPSSSVSPASLQRVLRWYPGARFLHLVRHPVANCESLLEVWNKLGDRLVVVPERLIPFHLIYVHRTISAFLSRLPESRWRRVRGEDVLSDPEGTLVPVLEWLGVRVDDEALAALRHPERSPYARPGPDGARGGNAPKFQRDPKLRPPRRPPSLELPAGWPVTPLWREELVDLGERLGYSEEEQISVPSSDRLRSSR
jgi:hypothetical protein